MTLQQIQDALSRGAKVFNGYSERVLAIHGDKYAYINPDNELWTNPFMETEITQDGLSKWRIEGKYDSTHPDPFQKDGFVIDCPSLSYAQSAYDDLKGLAEEPVILLNFDLLYGPGQKYFDNFPKYLLFEDRDTWLAHAKAIKEREREKEIVKSIMEFGGVTGDWKEFRTIIMTTTFNPEKWGFEKEKEYPNHWDMETGDASRGDFSGVDLSETEGDFSLTKYGNGARKKIYSGPLNDDLYKQIAFANGIPLPGVKWRPKEGEEYFYVSISDEDKYRVYSYYWHNDTVDNSIFDTGLIFQTSEEAKAAAKKMLEAINPTKG